MNYTKKLEVAYNKFLTFKNVLKKYAQKDQVIL